MSNRRPTTLLLVLSPVLVAAAPARASDVPPERLLPPTTQVYYRWDGVKAHPDAYRKSARGQMLAGDTGKFLTALYERLVQLAVRTQVGEPVLQGGDADALALRHAAVRHAVRLPQLVADTGLVVGFEVRPPAIKLEHVTRLFGIGKPPERKDPLADLDVQLTLILPGAAGRAEPAALIRFLRGPDAKPGEVRHLGRAADEVVLGPVRVTTWVEGKHFVATIGTVPAKTAIERVAKAGDGITAHPLYRQLDRKQSFEVVSRAYADVPSLWRVLRLLLTGSGNGEFVPVVELTGLPAVQAVRVWEGFDGAESRGVAEADLSGPREGVAKLYKQGRFDLKDLPPLPAEVNRWSAGVFDITAGYEMFLGFFALRELDGPSKTKADLIASRQELADEIDGLLGIKFGDLLANLDGLGVTYQTPGDGFLNAGQVFAVRVKDEAAARAHLRQFVQGLTRVSRDELRVTRRTYHGVETHEFAGKEGGFFRPTAVICDGWMAWGFFPQSVHGFVLRSKGKLPAWKPDASSAAKLAAIPPGPAAVQWTDPRPTVKLALGAGQPFAEYLNGRKDLRGVFDPGLLPNPEEACRPLFPNVHWTHNDGKTVRWESRDSLALPLDLIGVEVPLGYLAAQLLR